MNLPPRFHPPLGPPRPNPKQRILTDWHGVDLAPLEKVSRRPARGMKELMPALLQRLRMDRRQAEAEILRVWNHTLDPTLVAHAKPTGLNRGTLFVTVDSSVWLDEILRYRRREILARLQSSFGRELIQRISFRIG